MSENPADVLFRLLSPEEQAEPENIAWLDEARKYCDEPITPEELNTPSPHYPLNRKHRRSFGKGK